MPRVYNAAEGDTLTKIAIIWYGTSSKVGILKEANPAIKNPNQIMKGSPIIIPVLPERKSAKGKKTDPLPQEIFVTPETIDSVTGLSEEVAIVIEGEPFRLWPSVDLTFSFDTIGDEFTMSTPWYPEIDRYRKVFKPNTYKDCVIYIGGQKALSGTITDHSTSSNSKESLLTIKGYSKAGILSSVTASSNSWPLEFSGLNLFQICEKLARPFGLKVLTTESTGGPFKGSDKISIEPDQKIYDFLIDIAKQRGFVLSSDRDGNLLLQKASTQKADITILDGQYPFISGSMSIDGDKRFSDVTCISSNSKKGAGQKVTISDPELKRNGIIRPLVYKSSDTNSGSLKDAATSKLGRDIASSMSLSVDVIGWRDPLNRIWSDNRRVIYQSDKNMIYKETEFLIRQVNLKKTPNASDCSLTLVFPECYSGKIRESFPWE